MKELLKKLLQYVEENPEPIGLCSYICDMYVKDLIDYVEKQRLLNYIQKHRPKRGKFCFPGYEQSLWYWPKENQMIRKMWLEEQIKRTPHKK